MPSCGALAAAALAVASALLAELVGDHGERRGPRLSAGGRRGGVGWWGVGELGESLGLAPLVVATEAVQVGGELGVVAAPGPEPVA